MEDLQDKIIELMDLFDGEVTTADKIDRPERALEKEAIDDFMKRNPMAGGGMLVQPGFGGTRQGYAKDKRQYKSAEEKYTGSAKPPKKKKWQGVFGKEKADEIYNDYVKFYTDAYNNKNMSQVGEAEEYFKKVYGEKDGRKASDLLKRNGYTNLKAAPYELKQKLLIELVDDAQSKLKFTNKFDIIDKVFTESAAKQARANGLSSFLGKSEGRQRLSWFGEDLFNKVNSMDKIDDKISKALDYMVENNIEIKDVKKATGSVFTQGTSAGDKSRMSPIKKTIVSLVDNGKDGISRALFNKGLKKNAWYQSQTQNGKNLFDYVAREYGTEFIGEGFLDAYESGKSRFGRVTVKGSTQMPLPESLIFQFAARSADRNFKAGTYEDGPVKITDLKGNELDFGSLPVNERGQRIFDPNKHKFTYNGTLYGKNNLRKLGYQSGDFTEVYQIAQDFKSYGDELVPNPKNPNGKKIPFRKLMDMAGIDYFMAIGHDDSKGGVRTRPFNNFQIQNKFVNKSLDSAYRQVKNKDLRKRIADDIYGDLKGLRGQAYKDAWIKNNTKLLNDIILNRNVPPSLYRQAGENIIKSDVFKTFSKKKQDEVIRVSGLKKTEIDNLLLKFAGTITDECAVDLTPKKDGGRIGFKLGSERCLKIAKQGLDNGLMSGFKNKQQVNLAETILRAGGGLKSAFALRNIFGPAAIAATVAFEGGLIGYDMLTSGKTLREAFGDNLLNYALGKDYQIDPQEEMFKRFKGLGYDNQQIGSIKRALDAMNTINTGAQLAMDVGQQQEALQKSRGQPETFMGLEDQFIADTAGQRAEQNLKDVKNQLAEFNRDLVRSGQQDELSRYIESGDYAKGFDLFEQAEKEANIQKLESAGPKFMGSVFPQFEEGRQEDLANLRSIINPAFNIPGARDATFIPGKTTGGLFGLAEGGRAGYKLGKGVKIKPSKVRSDAKSIIDENIKLMKQMKETGEIDEISSDLNQVIKQALDEDLFDKKDRIVDSINISEAKKRRNYPYNMQVFEEPKNLDFYTAIQESNFRTKTGPYFDRIRRLKRAGGGLLKQAGDRSGPPPESGPNSQGLQGLLNRVKNI